MTSRRYDVAVVGGGPAGGVAGMVSSRLGLQTIVLDAGSRARWKPGELLAPECNPILDRLGLLPSLATRPDIALRSAGVRSAWGSNEIFYRDGFQELLGAGWIIDRRAFEELLRERAVESGVEWAARMRVHLAERSDVGWRLCGSGDRAGDLHARVIIDATGRPASISRRLGVRRIQFETQTASVVAWSTENIPEGSWVNVESAPDGWWYATSGPCGKHVLAWFQGKAGIRSSIGRLRVNMHGAFKATRFIQSVVAMPPWHDLRHQAIVNAGSAALERSAGEGWLAVGDAATAFDPISSQGLSNAIASAHAAAQAAHDWIHGDRNALDAYSAKITATYEIYRRGLRAHYQSKSRWRDRTFWTGWHADHRDRFGFQGNVIQ